VRPGRRLVTDLDPTDPALAPFRDLIAEIL